MARHRQVLASGHHLGHADSRAGSAPNGLAVGEQGACLDNRAEIRTMVCGTAWDARGHAR